MTEKIDENESWVMPWREDFVISDLNSMEIVAQTALEPATDESLAQAIDTVWETLQCPTLSLAASRGYIEALSDIPGDLIWDAVARLMRTYVYPTPPKPAHFREQVEEEMRERRLILHRVKLMNANQEYLKCLRKLRRNA